VPLCADDVETAGIEGALFQVHDLGANFRLLACPLLFGSRLIDLLAYAHLDVAAKLNVRAATAMLVAIVMAPGTPPRDDDASCSWKRALRIAKVRDGLPARAAA